MAELQQQWHGWKHSTGHLDTRYILSIDQDPTLVHHCIAQLFHARAVPNHDNLVADIDPLSTPWQQMIENNFVQQMDINGMQGFQLTPLGLRSIKTAIVHNVPYPIFKVREGLASDNLTSFELALTLRDGGWQWQRMPAMKDRPGLSYVIADGERVFYTIGSTLIKPYLLCLIQAQQLALQYGTQVIPHYCTKPKLDYTNILSGKEISDQNAQKRLALMNESFQDDDGPNEDVIGEPEPLGVEDGMSLEQALEAALDAYLLEQLQQDEDQQVREVAAMEEALVAADDGDGDGAPGDGGDDGGDDGDGDGAPDDTDPGGSVDIVPHVQPIRWARARGIGPRNRLLITPWGCQDIARVPLQSGQLVLKCRCKFHRKNDSTDCQKTLHFDLETEQAAMAAARWWLNQSSFYNRQRDHMGCMKGLWSVPQLPYDLLLQGQIVEAPAQHMVKSDVELDAAEARDVAARVAVVVGNPSDTTRAGRGRGGRQRADGSDSSEMGSQHSEPEKSDDSDSSQMASRHSDSD